MSLHAVFRRTAVRICLASACDLTFNTGSLIKIFLKTPCELRSEEERHQYIAYRLLTNDLSLWSVTNGHIFATHYPIQIFCFVTARPHCVEVDGDKMILSPSTSTQCCRRLLVAVDKMGQSTL